MTALDRPLPPTDIVAPTDLRAASRMLAALLIPVGPLAVAVLRYVLPYATTDDPGTVAQDVLDHQGVQSAVVWLGLVAVLTLVPAVLALARLTRRGAPRLTMAAVLLAVPGYLSLGWLVGGDLLLWTGAKAGLDAATLTSMVEVGHPTSTVAAVIFVLGHVFGTIMLGVAMWASGTVPRWAAVLTIVSQPLHFVAAVILTSPPLDLAAWGMTAVGFTAGAVAIWRLRDEAWDLPPEARPTA